MRVNNGLAVLAIIVPVMIAIASIPSDPEGPEWPISGPWSSPKAMFSNVTSGDNNGSLNITPIDVPNVALEGSRYNASFEPFGNGSSLSIRLNQSGPYISGWLQASLNGSVWGIPRDRDVGIWNMSLVLHPINGTEIYHNWSVVVSNEPPIIEPLNISALYEHSRYTYILNGSEGTRFSILNSSENYWYSNGVLMIEPVVRGPEKEMRFEIEGADGHGARTYLNLTIPIINVAPSINGELPTTVRAWEDTQFLGSTNEDEFYRVDIAIDPPIPFMDQYYQSGSRHFRLRPLNIDVGNHSYVVRLTDEWGASRNYTWDLTVEANDKRSDPELSLDSAEWASENGIMVSFGIDPGDAAILSSTLRHGSGSEISLSLEDRSNGYVILNVTDADATRIEMTLEVEFFIRENSSFGDPAPPFFYRNMSVTRSIDIEGRPVDGDGNNPLPFIIAVIVSVIIVLLMVMVAMVERTSYALQTLLLKGGSPREEEVLSAIQTRPGITWSGLLRSTGSGRRTAIASILSLEAGGYIYEQPVGADIRFYPMMGSFKDRPLSLSRYQWQIAKAMLSSPRGMDENDISSSTGIPPGRVRKECNLMELKGAITIIRRPTLDVYRLSGNQRENLKRKIRE